MLTSPSVKDGGDLPKEFTGDGEAATLPLEWSGAPKGTRSYAVIMHHIAPDQTKWYWILYNIPPDVTSLPKNVKDVGTLGNNSVNRRTEYAPPHSKGPGAKTYIYTVYALSAPPTVTVRPEEVNREFLLTAMKDLILGSAELHVVYTRLPEPDRPAARQGGDPPPPPETRGSGGISTIWIPLVAGSIAAALLFFAGPRLMKASWSRRPWVGGTALALLLCGHFCMLMMYFEPAIGTPDASGYCVQTRLMATEGRTWFARESPLQYINHHWLSPSGDRYFSQYPPGLSAMSAGIFRVAGPAAALLVDPVLASLTLLGLFLLCRLWIGPGWALLATALMAVNPITNEHALSCDSHTPVAFLLVWGLYLLALWSRNRSPLLALSAGFVLGIIPTVRYPEALFLLAAGIFMLLHWSRDRKSWRSLLGAVVGLLIPISCLAVRNHLAFGSFWKTGYTLTNEQSSFAWDSLVHKALPYVVGILGEGSGLVAGIGLIAIVVLCVRRATWREGLLLLALVVLVTVLYMAYALPEASLRFLIPTFSVYIVAAVWGFKLLADRQPRLTMALVAATIAGTACWGLPRSFADLGRLERDNAALVTVTRAVTEHAPPGSIVIADPRFQQQLDYVGQWKLIDESLLTGNDPDARGGPPDRNGGPDRGNQPRRNAPGGPRAVHEQERQQIMARYTDRAGPAVSGRMLDDLDAWRGTGKVYWVGDLAQIRRQLPQSDQLRVLATVKVTSPERRPPPGPGPLGTTPPRPPQDRERRDDTGRERPGPRPDGAELVVAEWTRAAAH